MLTSYATLVPTFTDQAQPLEHVQEVVSPAVSSSAFDANPAAIPLFQKKGGGVQGAPDDSLLTSSGNDPLGDCRARQRWPRISDHEKTPKSVR